MGYLVRFFHRFQLDLCVFLNVCEEVCLYTYHCYFTWCTFGLIFKYFFVNVFYILNWDKYLKIAIFYTVIHKIINDIFCFTGLRTKHLKWSKLLVHYLIHRCCQFVYHPITLLENPFDHPRMTWQFLNPKFIDSKSIYLWHILTNHYSTKNIFVYWFLDLFPLYYTLKWI